MNLLTQSLNLNIPVAQVLVMTLIARKELSQLNRVAKADLMMKDALDFLVKHKVVLRERGFFMLNENNTLAMRFSALKFSYKKSLGTSIMSYLAGKFGMYKGRMYPIAPVNAMKDLREFLEDFPGAEADLLEGLQFYFDNMLERKYKAGRPYYPYVKKLQNILKDKPLLNTIMAKEPVYNTSVWL